MRKKTTTLDQFMGLEYVSIVRVPLRASEHGDIVDMNLGELELKVAKAIIKGRIPLRGKEIKVLRKALGYSLERFAAEIKLTSGSIFKWENKPDDRLHVINEIAVRLFFAEKLGLEISAKYSDLLATNDHPEVLVLKAS